MNYIKISKFDIANGPGVRVVLWCSGCTLQCAQCQNPGTWDFKAGEVFTDETMDELLDALAPQQVQGLTLSGGHPLEPQNRKETEKIIIKVKKMLPEKDLWLYTGYSWEQIMKDEELMNIVKMCDVVVDGPFIPELRDITLKFRGSSNQRLIDVKRTIDEGRVIVLE